MCCQKKVLTFFKKVKALLKFRDVSLKFRDVSLKKGLMFFDVGFEQFVTSCFGYKKSSMDATGH